MTPHIRVLRVEAAELLKLGQAEHADAKASTEADEFNNATVEFTSALFLTRMAQAKFAAADKLESEEQALAETVARKPGEVEHQPKGRGR